MHHRFIKALLNQKVDKTPVWLMRQAGRYLPEYRKLRSQVRDFTELCKNSDLATEITLQPLERFDLDAAILFSDILVIPEAMGLELSFIEGSGPHFSNPIKSIHDIEKLRPLESNQDLSYVMDTIKKIKRTQLSVPLIANNDLISNDQTNDNDEEDYYENLLRESK